MPVRERGEGEQVGLRVHDHHRDLRMGPAEHGRDLTAPLLNVPHIGLGEESADDGGHHLLGHFQHHLEDVAHEVSRERCQRAPWKTVPIAFFWPT